MMKSYDLMVKTGTYEQDGQTKNRYENIGIVMDGERGPFMLLKKTFNPAGVETEAGRDMVMVSMFAPKDENQRQKFDDDIPVPKGSKPIPKGTIPF